MRESRTSGSVGGPGEQSPGSTRPLMRGKPATGGPEGGQDPRIDRVHSSFGKLRGELEAYNPDLLIIIGGDQSEMFDRSNVPNLMIYTGDVAIGINRSNTEGGEPSEADIVRLKVDVATSEMLLRRLVAEEDFDVAMSQEQLPLGRGKGLPHAFTRPMPLLQPKLNIPVVIFYQNTYDPPSLSADRCYQLGRALARVFKNDPRRVAIYGSGGASSRLVKMATDSPQMVGTPKR